ncbi:hypothetical protein R7X46_00235 [Mesomycoplasma ovipneumoniae]|uniref:Uncharacterized protein n=1 Tax=Mesomycoplasma ovipneumoniae TaxID=29562 RepID=A0AAP5Y509_9BACT|nr:hypothetical protein [Mesomycoplasma ovipneumoniae]MDW2907442.1 hypothetical protein [Mesomycoplasma ovipneumoniae]MDW2910114.1 hypothetical protein [Mesomycoplasma ovipneumoniae]MDW2916575.1 hypothetical protein [Mesomycoplasma ovipneumoniae]MDW2917112.1 hypothetical protein [Mesomycoplasma ovipneumoniae]MDW2926948.1 hypothetical protein [Mesomycoplasma ovipneumoniae]
MAYLDKKRKDGLLQSDAFYNELFLGLFGFGFWYLGRISLAIIRFTFTLVGLLMIFISQMMYLGSTAQDEIARDVQILTITGGVILGLSVIWNIITLIMIFTADLRDGKSVKIVHWGTEVEDNPELENEFDNPPVEQPEPVSVAPMEQEPAFDEPLDLQVQTTEEVYVEPEEPVFVQPEPEIYVEPEPVYEEPVFEPTYYEAPAEQVYVEPQVEIEPEPVVNLEENLDIARQIEIINAEQVQASQLNIVHEMEIPVDLHNLKHIHHTTFTIEEIESGIVDEHFEIRGQHDINCHS